VVEEMPFTHASMPIIHITLECATPTSHPDGAFRTLVAVTDAELRDGRHVSEAVRRASIIGFGGPHRVLASKRIGAVTADDPVRPILLDGDRATPSMRDRLDLSLGTCMAVEEERSEPGACRQLTVARRHESATRVGIRG
jgi:hypothetical protein